MKTMTTCSEQTGWFTSQSTEEFRKYVKQYIVKRIVEFIALPEVTFAKSKESDGIDEEEIDKTISTIEAYLNDNQLNESDLSHMDETIKWLKKYRDAANQPYVSLYPSQRSAALHLSSTVKAASSSASKSAAPSSVPSIVAQSDSVRKRPSSSNPVPILAAAPIATSSEVYQAAQGLTNLYDTKAFQTLADSSDSEEDYY